MAQALPLALGSGEEFSVPRPQTSVFQSQRGRTKRRRIAAFSVPELASEGLLPVLLAHKSNVIARNGKEIPGRGLDCALDTWLVFGLWANLILPGGRNTLIPSHPVQVSRAQVSRDSVRRGDAPACQVPGCPEQGPLSSRRYPFGDVLSSTHR